MAKATRPVEQGGPSGGSAVELPLDGVWDFGEQEKGQAFVMNSFSLSPLPVFPSLSFLFLCWGWNTPNLHPGLARVRQALYYCAHTIALF